MNNQQNRSGFLTLLGSREAWSWPSFVVVLTVSTIVFVFGNISAVAKDVFLTLTFNTVACALIFLMAILLIQNLDKKLSLNSIGITVLTTLILLSVIRGALMQQLFNFLNFEDGFDTSMRILLSLSVFLPGLLLSVIAVNFISKWRTTEQVIRELTDQRNRTFASIEADLTTYLAQVSKMIKENLGPQISEIPKLTQEQAKSSLREMVQSVIRPVSHSLNESLPNLIPPAPATDRVTVKEFLTRTLKDQPLSPGLTAIIFALILLPRNLAQSPGLTGFVLTVLLGLFVHSEIWLVNLLSKKLMNKLSIGLHLLAIVVLLLIFGSVTGLVAQLSSSSTLGFDSIYLVGAMANTTLALLIGGIVSANNTLASQRLAESRLVIELQQELTKARQIQFQRNRAMSKWLHGPLQGALNVAVIQISRAKNSAELGRIQDQITKDIEKLINELDQADQVQTGLAAVIEKIADTWQDITEIDWNLGAKVLDRLRGSVIESAVSDVLLEAVFNAIKHCSPESIQVDLFIAVDQAPVLKVSHAGAITQTSTKGLGSKIIDYLTLENSLQEQSGQVVFTATFPKIVQASLIN